MTFRGNGTLITHNNTAYIPSSLMPGYCGHIPTSKFLCGETFGNSSLKYLRNIRSAKMASSKSSDNSMPRSSHTQDSILPYWVQYNVGFKRQNEIKDFSVLSQKHRENYKDKTGTVQPVNYFVMPEKGKERIDHAISDGGSSLMKSNGVHRK